MKTKQLQQKRMLAIVMLLTLSSFIDISAQSVGSTFTVNNCVRWVRGTSDSGYIGIRCRVLSTDDAIAEGYNGTVEGYWNSGDDSEGFFYATEIEIPEYVTYDNKRWRVSSICQIPLCQGSGAKLKKAILPNSLEIIGHSAFDDVGYGTKFEIVGAKKVKKIGDRAFWYCKQNSSFIDFTYVEEIGRQAFYHCDSLHVVRLPNIKKLGNAAFWRGATNRVTDGLFELELGNDLDEIPDSCFMNQSNLTDFIIPGNVTRIGKNAFRYCTSLRHVVIPEKVKTIEVATFQSCTRMSYIELPSGLTQIKDSAFYNCSSLDTLVVNRKTPPSVLGSRVFFDCPRSVLYVPYGCKAAYQAANYWNNFKQIIEMAPENLATSINLNQSTLFLSIGGSATLTATILPAGANQTVEWTSSNNNVATINNGVVTAIAAGTAVITATTADGTNLTAQCNVTVITNGIVFADANVKALCIANWDTNVDGELSLAEAAAVSDLGTVFTNNTQITSFNELSNFTGITSIGSQAFNGCTGLSSITIPENVISIGGEAFNGCTGLASITIPENITTIGSDAFKGCTGLTKAEFANIEDLCSMVFENYEANPLYNAHHLYINGEEITELVVPNSVTSIGNYSFKGCSSLTSATIPNSVTEIGISTFSGCTSLSSVSLPDNLTKISDGMFTNCSNLASIIIPEPVTYIGKCAFQQSGITSIVIPNSVTTLAERDVFTSCSSLTSVYIGSGLKVLKNSHFYGCENLTKAEFASIEDLCGIEFSEGRFPYSNPLYYAHHLYINGEEVTDLVIPNSVTKIGYYTFIGCSSITSVTIPESVTEIKNLAFSGCSGITTVKMYKETPLSNCPFQNRANAILYVPAGCKATYQAADLWNEFSEIIEMGGDIIAGDANGDGSVNVTDYLAIANYILGSNTANFDVAAADVNGDNDINVSDYVGVANIILYGNWQGPSVNGSRAMGAEETSPWMEIGLSEDGKMNLLLRDTKPFSAFQMDIRLPEGVEIADVNMAKANQTKDLGYSRLQDGTWRLLYGTLDNKTVNLAGDNLLTLELASSNSNIGGLVTVDNIFLADRNASVVRLNAVQSGLPTGIYSIESGVSINGNCYDLTGRRVDNSQLKKGVYIVNGKKTFVK